MMNFIKQMAKDMAAGYQGKLNVYPNGFKFSDKGATNISGVFFKARPSFDGRMTSLSLGVRTVNGCPEPPPGDYPQNDRRRFFVPLSECRKCPHHIKRRRGQPYPCCAVLRKLAQAGPTPVEKMAGALRSAEAKAKELLA